MRHVLANIIQRGELRDPALHEVPVTVTDVEVSPDLRNATVFIMPLGGEGAGDVLDGLRRAMPFLRRELGKAIRLRYTPDLHFKVDTSFDEAARIERLLAEGRGGAVLRGPGAETGDGGDTGDKAAREPDDGT